jgi:hypothetical protein
MKKIIFLIIILAVFLLGQNVLAFDTKSIVNLEAPYATFYKGTFDNLVLDFSLIVTSPDTLKALELKNLGTADYLHHISYLKLWADSGPVGFQGMGIDKELGSFTYSSTYIAWYLDNLIEKITDSQRFFVSADIYSGLSTGATINMQIPVLADDNSNGSFDVGDLGIFMDSGKNGPTDNSITNSNSQVLSTLSVDSLGPKIVITNLFEGNILNSDHFTIQGMIRDQGNTYIKEFNIIIDGQPFSVQEVDPVLYTWSYDWQNVTNGAHTISVQGRDAWGNNTQTADINITVSPQALSLTNSSATIDKTAIKNDGLDKATVVVILKDTNNQAIANRQIVVESSSGMIISLPNNNSDTNGQIVFEVRSTSLGIKTVTIKADGQVLKTLSLNVMPSVQIVPGINYGDLIKASGPAVYYYGADGKRYVFPYLKVYNSWYSDFSSVKTITDEQLATITIGGNVTYKPGVKMVKINTDPKVYAVAAKGTLRWIKTEQIAKELYGDNWANLVEDVPDAFFVNYQMGEPIELSSDFNPLLAQTVNSINIDKGLQ